MTKFGSKADATWQLNRITRHYSAFFVSPPSHGLSPLACCAMYCRIENPPTLHKSTSRSENSQYVRHSTTPSVRLKKAAAAPNRASFFAVSKLPFARTWNKGEIAFKSGHQNTMRNDSIFVNFIC